MIKLELGKKYWVKFYENSSWSVERVTYWSETQEYGFDHMSLFSDIFVPAERMFEIGEEYKDNKPKD